MYTVVVVDDSAFMRKVIADIFNATGEFTVVATARNGGEAVEKTRRFKPDLVTMDVEMPGMDGLAALAAIMRESPSRVLMVSSLTRSGTDATIKALELGAVDFVAKAGGTIAGLDAIREDLLTKARLAVKTDVQKLVRLTAAAPQLAAWPALPQDSVVAIGTSTGGPRALHEIITKLPGDFPAAVLVVQHMPPGFTKSLAERLSATSSLLVKEGENGEAIIPGRVYIAPGDFHMTVALSGLKPVLQVDQSMPVGGHRPAVDPLFMSVARVFRDRAVGVVLTGMGHDGAQGLQAIKENGGRTVAEDQSSAVVFGMPKAAIETGCVDVITPLSGVVQVLQRFVGR